MSEEHVHGPDCDHDHDHDEGDGLVVLQLLMKKDDELELHFDRAAFKAEPARWGVVLADLARAIGDAMTPEGGKSDELLAEIREYFLAALEVEPDETPEE